MAKEVPVQLTSGKQERKGLMGRVEPQTLRLWSPSPGHPMVAITEPKENEEGCCLSPGPSLWDHGPSPPPTLR